MRELTVPGLCGSLSGRAQSSAPRLPRVSAPGFQGISGLCLCSSHFEIFLLGPGLLLRLILASGGRKIAPSGGHCRGVSLDALKSLREAVRFHGLRTLISPTWVFCPHPLHSCNANEHHLSRIREFFTLDLISFRSFYRCWQGAPYSPPQPFPLLGHHGHSQWKWRRQLLHRDQRTVTWDSHFGGNFIPGIHQLVAPEISVPSNLEWQKIPECGFFQKGAGALCCCKSEWHKL